MAPFRHQKLKERSNILILGATEQDDDTGGAVTYMHLHVRTHTEYRGDAYLIHVRLLIKTG